MLTEPDFNNFQLPGYTDPEALSDVNGCRLFRMRRANNGERVLIKCLPNSSRQPLFRMLLQNEYRFGLKHQFSNITKTEKIDAHRDTLALQLEHIDGEPLQKLLATNPPDFKTCLDLMAQLARILSQLHRQQIIHKDIRPENILVNRKNWKLYLSGFGMACTTAQEKPAYNSYLVHVDHLAYIAPEQTGRMNRELDHRSDFYSLGVTLFLLLTGELPLAHDGQRLQLQDLLTVVPQSVARLCPDIPQTVSDIVDRCLQKNPEHRYQSAIGLQKDLEYCARQWRESNNVIAFQLAKHDVHDRFLIPNKLYGREHHLKQIEQAFVSATKGGVETILLTGPAGIGKSTLVQEVFKTISERSGLFIAGKFDQAEYKAPYSAWIQAVRSHLSYLLVQQADELEAWRDRLVEELGDEAQLVIDLIPELERIIGPKKASANLPPIQSRNRFSLLFLKFIRVFSRSQSPLTLFFDDLQWADSGSIDLLSMLANSAHCCPECQHLLILGAYRDSDFEPDNPLRLLTEQLRSERIDFRQQRIGPLSADSIHNWLHEILRGPRDRIFPLAELLAKTTRGNPLMIREGLQFCHDKGLIVFDRTKDFWTWKLAEITAFFNQVTADRLFRENFASLTDPAKNLLQKAACIGPRFDVATLHEITALEIDQVYNLLEEVAQQRRIYRLDIAEPQKHPPGFDNKHANLEFRFSHDQIYRSIYRSIDPAERAKTHHSMGNTWLEKIADSDHDPALFDTLNQLNLGSCASYEHNSDQCQLARLNLKAGQLAEFQLGFRTAMAFYQKGIDSLGEHPWRDHYPLTLKLTSRFAESSLYSGNYQLLDSSFKKIVSNSRGVLDNVAVYQIKIRALTMQRAFTEAVDFALDAVQELGLTVPNPPRKMAFQLCLLQIKLRSGRANIDDLVERTPIGDPRQEAIADLLVCSLMAALVSQPLICAYSLLQLTLLSLRHGINPGTSVAFIGYAGICCESLGDIETGWRFAVAGTKLMERFKGQEINNLGWLTQNCFVAPWKIPLREILPSLDKTIQQSLSQGDFLCAIRAALAWENYAYFAGVELQNVGLAISEHDKLIAGLKQRKVFSRNLALRQTLSLLTNPSADKMDRTKINATFLNQVYPQGEDSETNHIFLSHFHKLIVNYLFFQIDDAWDSLVVAQRRRVRLGIGAYRPILNVFDSLIRIARLRDQTPSQRRRSLRRIVSNQKKLKNWAHHAPENYQHKYLLVAAELAAAATKYEQAGNLYEQAILAAENNRVLNDIALISELAARFYRAQGRSISAANYLRNAAEAYRRWGAWAKVSDLQKQIAKLGGYEKATETQSFQGGHHPLPFGLEEIRTLSSTAETLSNHAEKPAIIEQLMDIITHKAPAERTALILKQDNQLQVAADCFLNVSRSVDLQVPIESYPIPTSILSAVANNQQTFCARSYTELAEYSRDPSIANREISSILCIPGLKQGETKSILYLENLLERDQLLPASAEILKFYLSLAWISIENANLTKRLQQGLKKIREDVDALKSTEARLRESENHTRAILETSLDAVISINAEGTVVEWSANAENIFEWSTEEACGRSLATLVIPPEYRDAHNKGLKRFLATGQGNVTNKRIEINALRKDGQIIPVELAIAPIYSKGEYTFSAFVRDLTEQKQAEAELDRQREALHQSEKLNALGSLLAGVSHELNNPLSIVVGRSMMLESEVTDPEIAQVLGRIRSAAERCARIVKSFLAIARQQEPNRELLDMNELIESVLDFVSYGLKTDGIEIETDLDPAIPRCHGDIDQLRQVITNIVVNAQQALRGIQGPRRVHIKSAKNCDNTIVVTINDSGPGIPAEIESRIFEPFYTTKGIGEGTGFGLSYSRGVVESHGGSLQLEKPTRAGACFVITLPIEQRQRRAGPKTEQPVDVNVQPFHILIVDDETEVAEMLSDILRKEGHSTRIADNGKTALECIDHHRFDLIVCDLHMPEMDGFSFSKQINRSHPDLYNRIVFITGDSLGMGDSQSIKSSGRMIIDKPVVPEEFTQTINKILIDLDQIEESDHDH